MFSVIENGKLGISEKILRKTNSVNQKNRHHIWSRTPRWLKEAIGIVGVEKFLTPPQAGNT